MVGFRETVPMGRSLFVIFLWEDAVAESLDPVGRLIYRSNLLGQDQRVTNTGGGNTSSKVVEEDPLTGHPVEILWVKGSGGDLRTSSGIDRPLHRIHQLGPLISDRLCGGGVRHRAFCPAGNKGLRHSALGERSLMFDSAVRSVGPDDFDDLSEALHSGRSTIGE